MTIAQKMKYAKKAVVALFAGLAQALVMGLIPEPYNSWGAVLLAVGGSLGVYYARNTERNPDPATSVADEDAVEAEEDGKPFGVPEVDPTTEPAENLLQHDDYEPRHQRV